MIGTHIRQLREEKGYLLRQMAAILDVDPTILSKMEREERKFKREHVVKISEVCQVREDELITMWLADKISYIVEDEKCAVDALNLVKEQKENE